MHLAWHNTPNLHMYTELQEPTSTPHSTICLQFIALHTARSISRSMGVIHPQGMCTHLSKNTQAYEDELLVQAAILYCKFIKLRTYKQWQWEIRTWHSCMLISHAQRTHCHTIDASPTHTYKVCTQLHTSVPFDEPRLIHINYWPTKSMSRSGAEASFSCYWEKTSAAERFRWSTNAHCTYVLTYVRLYFAIFSRHLPYIFEYVRTCIPLPSSPELLLCSPAFHGHTGHRSHRAVSGWAWTPPSGLWSRARVWPGQAWSDQLHVREWHVRTYVHMYMKLGWMERAGQCDYSVCELAMLIN